MSENYNRVDYKRSFVAKELPEGFQYVPAVIIGLSRRRLFWANWFCTFSSGKICVVGKDEAILKLFVNNVETDTTCFLFL